MSTDTQSRDLATAVLESRTDGELVLAIPHTEYRLHLVPSGEIAASVGKRIKGVIEARALRIHRARGGGRFIEPVWGAPRIVAGKVLSVDQSNHRVLVDVSVPMWVTAPEGQDLAELAEGQLVNFYVESGAKFRQKHQAPG